MALEELRIMITSISQRLLLISRFVNSKVFGKSNLLLTNLFISASMGTLGDFIQQHYDIVTEKLKEGSLPDDKKSDRTQFNYTR